MASSIYRYKFRDEFLPTLIEFSRIHQYDSTKEFKEAFEHFIEINSTAVQEERKHLTVNGYKGDVINKMYKSARYYFKNKDYNPSENKKRRKYIKQDKDFIYSIDEHVIKSIRQNIKPAVAFNNLTKDNDFELSLENEKERLFAFLDTEEEVNHKIKKTYKNRYFIQKKILKQATEMSDITTEFVPSVSDVGSYYN